MNPRKTVLLKGELHNSTADLYEEKALLTDGLDVDVLVLEQSQSSTDYRLLAGWFSISIALLTWILESLYHSKAVLVDLATVQDIDVVYTREDDVAPLSNAPTTVKAMSAVLFYTLVPGSLWIGFATDSHLAGSLLLFLGLVLPVLVVRIYNTNRPDSVRNRDQLIAETIASAGAPDDDVLAIVGAGHLSGIERRLPEHVDVEVRPPVYHERSIRHVKNICFPTLKAGFVLFSLYVLCVWIVVRVVTYVSPLVAVLLA
jgi:hypothetical protein